MSDIPPPDNPYSVPPQDEGLIISREAALGKIKLPAILLLVTGILSLIASIGTGVLPSFLPDLLEQIQESAAQDPNFNDEQSKQFESLIQLASGIQLYISAVIGLIGSLLMIIGAVKMKQLESYGLSMTACICAIVPYVSPCCGCIFPMAIGIWGVVVLADQGVKQHFK